MMTSEVSLRDVRESDLAIFYDQQLDPEATRMAAFPSRGWDAFRAHWVKIMNDQTATKTPNVILKGSPDYFTGTRS